MMEQFVRSTRSALLGPPPKRGEEVWPMPVEHFLAGRYLKRSDIILTRKHRDWRSWLIRWATKGSFSHAALVFLVPYDEVGFDNTFVIESASDGVDLTNLADYLNDRRSVVGIRRLDQPWFDWEVQSRVRGRMLNSIKSSYSYRTVWRIARDAVDQLLYGVSNRVRGPESAIQKREARKRKPPNAFICSGLVQLGFLDSISALVREGKLPAKAYTDVVFDLDLGPTLDKTDWSKHPSEAHADICESLTEEFAEVFEAITPEELASTPKLSWVYIVRDGQVYPVMSDVDARKLLDWEPKE
jgi:hypothetical protein